MTRISRRRSRNFQIGKQHDFPRVHYLSFVRLFQLISLHTSPRNDRSPTARARFYHSTDRSRCIAEHTDNPNDITNRYLTDPSASSSHASGFILAYLHNCKSSLNTDSSRLQSFQWLPFLRVGSTPLFAILRHRSRCDLTTATRNLRMHCPPFVFLNSSVRSSRQYSHIMREPSSRLLLRYRLHTASLLQHFVD